MSTRRWRASLGFVVLGGLVGGGIGLAVAGPPSVFAAQGGRARGPVAVPGEQGPTSSSGAPRATAPDLGDWSGSIAITHTGPYTWTSSVVTVTQLPNELGCEHGVHGGSAQIANFQCVPVLTQPEARTSAVGAPAQLPTEWQVSFDVESYTGSPTMTIQASAGGNAS